MIFFLSFFFFALFFFVVVVFAALGLELRAYILSHSTSPFFVMGFFKIGSNELFAWAGFEPAIEVTDLWVDSCSVCEQ
jgi:hypothetical protein